MGNRRYRERDYLAKRVQKERQALVLAPIPASPVALLVGYVQGERWSPRGSPVRSRRGTSTAW
jgi:hypothetical protein